jgi:hypothetical protein
VVAVIACLLNHASDSPPWGWTLANSIVFSRIREVGVGPSDCGIVQRLNDMARLPSLILSHILSRSVSLSGSLSLSLCVCVSLSLLILPSSVCFLVICLSDCTGPWAVAVHALPERRRPDRARARRVPAKRELAHLRGSHACIYLYVLVCIGDLTLACLSLSLSLSLSLVRVLASLCTQADARRRTA